MVAPLVSLLFSRLLSLFRCWPNCHYSSVVDIVGIVAACLVLIADLAVCIFIADIAVVVWLFLLYDQYMMLLLWPITVTLIAEISAETRATHVGGYRRNCSLCVLVLVSSSCLLLLIVNIAIVTVTAMLSLLLL